MVLSLRVSGAVYLWDIERLFARGGQGLGWFRSCGWFM